MVKVNNMRQELQARDEELEQMAIMDNAGTDREARKKKEAEYEAKEELIDRQDRVRALLLEILKPQDAVPTNEQTEHVEDPKPKTQCHTVRLRYIHQTHEKRNDPNVNDVPQKPTIYEALFRITQYTTFDVLRYMAHDYWGIPFYKEMVIS